MSGMEKFYTLLRIHKNSSAELLNFSHEKNNHMKKITHYKVKYALFTILLLALLLGLSNIGWGQTTIWTENFTYSNGTTTGQGSPAITSWTAAGYTTGGVDVRNNQLRGLNTIGPNPDLTTWQIDSGDPIEIAGYSNISVNINISETGTLETSDYIQTQYSIDGGGWNNFATNGLKYDDFTSAVATQTGLSGSTLRLQIIMYNGSNEYYYADNIIVEGTPSGPILSALPGSLDFGYTPSGGNSTEQTYTLSGSNLTAGPIVVTAPTGFEISLNGTTWFSSVNVTYTPPTLGSTTIHVRFSPTGSPAYYSGNITNVGGGATTKNVAITGTSILTYCSAGSTTCDEYIAQVQVGTINNTTTCTTGGYADYTIQTTNMNIGSGYNITVTNGTPYTGDQCGIWVDWNQDGDFDDTDEAITISGGVAVFNATITPPTGATLGTTSVLTN
jgi:hypothetical protein